MEKRSKNTNMVLIIVLGVLIVLLGVASVYFYLQYQKIKQNPNAVAQQETDVLVKQVGKLITLPTDETPTVATIVDKDKLKDQPFFTNAQNGDKILIYTKAKKAIIYRPKDNKLINVGPIAINQNAVPVAIVNAGGDVGSVQNTLSSKLANEVSVTGTTDAKNKANVKSLTVVDVSGQNGQVAQDVAAAIGATVGALPAGEAAPQGASIVVFVK
ncbi:hypothetical protein HYX70_01750 [Candidatus Saccharibacteria bacterium]|nr:hypothetical protein [Candidatus Saccharibacteria bacterium]